tara:strand:+ start:3400 stop:4308 length:909 start_codon:yes stop_codon:yes gene_type:complete
LNNRKIILTGATGWLGKNAIYEYQKIYGYENLYNSVILIGSREREFELFKDKKPLHIYDLTKLNSIDSASSLLHLAFLTREKISNFGRERYVLECQKISKTVENFISRNPSIPIITISSGVASLLDKKNTIYDEYALLKKQEEIIWRKYSKNRLSLVFRLYAATGMFMPNPERFALGDFLLSSLAGNRLKIKSRKKVLRSYVHLGTLMNLCWRILHFPSEVGTGFFRYNACTDKIDILNLAKLISSNWDLPFPEEEIDYSLNPDDYTADSAEFIDLLSKFSLESPSLMSQIIETANFMNISN